MKNKKNNNKLSKNSNWALKITIITFLLALTFSYISEISTNLDRLFLPILILFTMIFISIVFDGIAVAVTSCDLNRLYYYKKDNIKVYRIAIMLVKNSEKVNNICADVVGDMCGILSGAAGASIVLMSGYDSTILSMVISSLIVSMTVGGKAFLKGIAVKNAEEFVIETAKFLSLVKRGRNGNTEEHK